MNLDNTQQIKVQVAGTVPKYATTGAAAADLVAYLDEAIDILPGKRVLIPTNTYLAIPEHYEGQVRPRSGLAIKHGITLINSPGTIDSDYRGEIQVPIINLGDSTYTVHNGDRIAHLVIAPCIQVKFALVALSELPNTDRGAGGFGSTGK